MTYYKYAERDATSRVNWSDVSKKWTDEINQIASDRDKKRTDSAFFRQQHIECPAGRAGIHDLNADSGAAQGLANCRRDRSNILARSDQENGNPRVRIETVGQAHDRCVGDAPWHRLGLPDKDRMRILDPGNTKDPAAITLNELPVGRKNRGDIGHDCASARR